MNNWTKEQIYLGLYLYCQLPFGKLHRSNPNIIALSKKIGRTPSSVAMKLCNIASLDPLIRNSGRNGLGNASALDAEVWHEFHINSDRIVEFAASQLVDVHTESENLSSDSHQALEVTERELLTKRRLKQGFFRQSVLSSYHRRSCMTGVTDERFLIASHIVPWSVDSGNRVNPSNGLCLAGLHDKAFDRGLISLDTQCKILLSRELSESKDSFLQTSFFQLSGKQIEMPEKFAPDEVFLKHHRNQIFLG